VSGTLNGLISALIGLARWKIGNALLKFFILRNRKSGKDKLFERGWMFVQRFHWFFSGRQLYRNRFQKNWRGFALIALVSAVKRYDASFAPKIVTKNHHLLTEPVKRDSPIVVATIHTGTETSLNRMFEELDMESAVIAASKSSPQRLSGLFGLKGTVDLINRSSDAFLIARRKMKDGKAICCCADFTIREAGTLYHDHYMATGLFDFAKRARARVIYAVSTVSEAGEIIINLAKPGIKEENSTAEELAHDFIVFISALTNENQVWRIGSWTPKTPDSPRQYSKYWIARVA
jgi:hypothetical protein